MRKREEREGGRQTGGETETSPPTPDLIILFNGAVYIYIYICFNSVGE